MLDESSLIQNTGAKQSKFILQLHPDNVILLSGTPTAGKYENLWSQIHLLGWNISKIAYWNTYVETEWIEDHNTGYKREVVTGYKNVERLKRKMREHGAVFMKTEEVFDLPKQIFTKIKVDRSKEYSKFMKDCIVWIDETELVGDTTLTKMLYARQLCGHYNKEKLSAFMDLIQSTEDRVIVFYSFNAELDALKAVCEECGRPVSEVNGRIKNLTAYEEESDSVTLVQYQAGSKGLNLQKCNKIIYFTLPLSSEDFEQSKKRIHRIGQEKTCFYYLMICRGSIEERILKTLEERKDFTDELFKDS
jgi:SNF2 family DNA or RNA helicase